jgi:elongation factor 1-alpha
MNKLCPENDDGNIEYKRYLINLDDNKLEHLATQMNWRLYEGDNLATYYLGVDDDGTPYNLSNREKKETLENFMKLLDKTNSEITNFETIKNNKNCYFKIDIRKKMEIYPEIRIILLGNSQTGKTTFLSNIILNKTNINNDARIYLLNHKHELESKKTSSINYSSLIYQNTRYVFIEAPGSEEYIKTKYKVLLGTYPNIALIFTNKEGHTNDFNINICQKMEIPYLFINIFNTELYNCDNLIDKSKLLETINKMKRDYIIPNLNYTKFIILNIYPHNDFGMIISGFLNCGSLEINQNVNLVYKTLNNNKIIKFKIKTIHINGESIKKIGANHLVSISLEKIDNTDICFDNKLRKNLKVGLVVDRIQDNIKTIKFKLHNISDLQNNNLSYINGFSENRQIQIKDIKKDFEDYTGIINNYYNDKYIITDNGKYLLIID